MVATLFYFINFKIIIMETLEITKAKQSSEPQLSHSEIIIAIGKEEFLFADKNNLLNPDGSIRVENYREYKEGILHGSKSSGNIAYICEVDSFDLALDYYNLWKKDPIGFYSSL